MYEYRIMNIGLKTFVWMFLGLCIAITDVQAQRKVYNFNSEWCVQVGDFPDARKTAYDDKEWKKVTLPYAFNEDEAFRVNIKEHTDTISWYRKHFRMENLKNKKVFIEFEGVRQAADFYLNGKHIGLHENGVMAVGLDLTPHLKEGENIMAVRVDNNWNYREKSSNYKYQWSDRNFNANYGGIPKNVFLHVMDEVYQTLPLYSNLQTTGVYIYATDFDIPGRKAKIHAESEIRNESDRTRSFSYEVSITDMEGKPIKAFTGKKLTLKSGETGKAEAAANVDGLHFWSWGYGYLYTVKTSLKDEEGKVFDEVSTRTGFRKTRFAEGKIWLNDRVIQMKGYAQRTSNEWPAVGLSVPAWLSDYSNGLMVESNGNFVRWMHVTPWKQDVESCDRVGLIQAMPAGDAEKDRGGRQWEHRVELMRDAIIYNRNNPSILFYESGNNDIRQEHMAEMIQVRNSYDPHGGRAIGSRDMLDSREAEYGGEMLYINKSKRHPMWSMEYCRDEGLRKYWDEYSYPFHKEGDGPLHKNKPARSYNHNQDMLAVEMLRRWYDYWRERPGMGERVNSGGAKIIFSDTNTHFRGAENYRRSGVVDPMRIEKDAFFVHQVIWNGWVDIDKHQTYIIGHWNYTPEVVKPVYVASNAEQVELFLNGQSKGYGKRDSHFLFIFDEIAWQPGKLEAVSYDEKGNEVDRYAVTTAGEAAALKLTAKQNPEGFHADGADMALLQIEVVDKNGKRCPLDNRMVKFTLKGEGEWCGGIAQGKENYIRSKELPVECGINRTLVRSTTKAGKITVVAESEGLPKVELTLQTSPVDAVDGKSEYLPQYTLKGHTNKGETPLTPSYTDTRRTIPIISAKAGSNIEDTGKSYDDNELSEWSNDGQQNSAWIAYTLEREALIDDVCLKLNGWRRQSYPLEIYAGGQLLWSGNTPPSLGYVHLSIENPIPTKTIMLKLKGSAVNTDNFDEITEVAGGVANKLEAPSQSKKGKHRLRIIEVEFLETIK